MIQQQLFLVLAFNSLICLGVHAATREGMIGESIRNFIHLVLWHLFYWICKNINRKRIYIKMNAQGMAEFWCKPLFDCPPCMASVWGLMGWFYFAPQLALVPYILALCGVNALISKLYYYGD
jgi:hypothetical protein